MRGRWDDGRPISAKAQAGRHACAWIAGLFAGVRRAAQRARDHLLDFIAIRGTGPMQPVRWALLVGACPSLCVGGPSARLAAMRRTLPSWCSRCSSSSMPRWVKYKAWFHYHAQSESQAQAKA